MDGLESPTQETKKNPKTKPSTLSVIKEFCGYTSIHGLGRTAGAKHLLQKFVWLLLFLGALGMAVYQLRELYLKYESRPVSTIMKLTNKATLRFPEVTFCNINPLHAALVKERTPELYREIMSTKGENIIDDKPTSWPSPSGDEDDENNKTSPDTTLTPPPTTTSHLNTSIDSEEDYQKDDFEDQSLSRKRRSQGENNEQGRLGEDNNNDIDDNEDGEDSKSGNNGFNGDDDYYDYDEDDDDDDFPVDPSELLASHKRQQLMYQFISEIGERVGYKIGHQFHDSVLNCSFRGIDCKEKMIQYWAKFWHHKYGICYTFNAKAKSFKSLKSNKAGPSHGLTLKLFVDQANYMSEFTRMAGYKIVINEQGLMKFPDEEGINVPPGVFASIGMRKVHIIRADPFNNNSCFDNKKQSNEGNLYYLQYSSKYSNNACRESCLAYNQRKYCNCSEFRFPFTDNTAASLVFNNQGINVHNAILLQRHVESLVLLTINESTATVLNSDSLLPTIPQHVSSSTSLRPLIHDNFEKGMLCPDLKYISQHDFTAKCLRNVNALFNDNKLNCSKECTPPCKEDYYKLSPSFAAWPSKKYEEEIDKSKNGDLNKQIRFSDNYLKISIFFEQLNYEIIEETVSYGVIDFVSDVGGQLGLWLGVSVLAATEVIELMMLIVIFLCKSGEKPERGMLNEGNNINLQEDLKLPNNTGLEKHQENQVDGKLFI